MQRRGEGFERERYEPGREPRREGLERESPAAWPPREEAYGAESRFSLRDLTHWSSIWAGFFVALSLIVLLGVLGIGLGFGFATVATMTPAGLTTSAAIWASVTLVVAFFCAGWFAARCSSVPGTTSGLIQGVTVWAVTTAILLVMGAFGWGGALGLTLGQGMMPSATTPIIAQGVAWGSFVALLLGLAAATFGGWLGGLMVRGYRPTRLTP